MAAIPQRNTKRLEFQIHDNLITQHLRRQAGSLWKAVIEGVMNSIDAMASIVNVTVTKTQVIIEDDGRGFRGREEIEKFFQVLGQPPEDGELKTYGEYRIGRGQLFSFGRNEWRSEEFRLAVNINKDSRGFEFTDKLDNVQGCKIVVSLYSPLDNLQLADTIDEIARNVKYVTTPVHVNGTMVNQPPAYQTWQLETADADIKFRHTGNLVVYNRGIRVMDIPYHKYGTGGDVVSKLRLRVNFARNDLMSDCPVWKRIAQTLHSRGNANRENRATNGYQTADDRHALAFQLKAGALGIEQAARAKVYTSITGTHATIKAVSNARYQGRITLGVITDTDFGKSLMRDKIAYVLHPSTLDRFGVSSLGGLMAIIRGHHRPGLSRLEAVEYAELQKRYAGEHKIARTEELLLLERAILEALNYGWRDSRYRVTRVLNLSHVEHVRLGRLRIELGSSSSREAWTDECKTYICINRDEVAKHQNTPSAIHHYFVLILGQLLIQQHSASTLAHHQQARLTLLKDSVMTDFTIRTFCYLPVAYQKLKRRADRRTLQKIDRIERAVAKNKLIFEETSASTSDWTATSTPDRAVNPNTKGDP